MARDSFGEGVRTGTELGNPILQAVLKNRMLQQDDEQFKKRLDLSQQAEDRQQSHLNRSELLDYVKAISGDDPNAFRQNYLAAGLGGDSLGATKASDRKYQDSRGDVAKEIALRERALNMQQTGQDQNYGLAQDKFRLDLAKNNSTNPLAGQMYGQMQGVSQGQQPQSTAQPFSEEAQAKLKDGKIEFTGKPGDLLNLASNPQTAPLLMKAVQNTFTQGEEHPVSDSSQSISTPVTPPSLGSESPKYNTFKQNIGGKEIEFVSPANQGGIYGLSKKEEEDLKLMSPERRQQYLDQKSGIKGDPKLINQQKLEKLPVQDQTFVSNVRGALENLDLLEKAIKSKGTYEYSGLGAGVVSSPESLDAATKLQQIPYELAIQYSKIVDPNSVAREGEVSSAKKYIIPGLGAGDWYNPADSAIMGSPDVAIKAIQEQKRKIAERVTDFEKTRGVSVNDITNRSANTDNPADNYINSAIGQ